MTGRNNDSDADVTNDTPDDPTFEAGPIRYDSSDGIPVGTAISAFQSSEAFKENGDWSDLQDAASSVAALGIAGFFYSQDPLGLLIYAGLDFLIDVIQPLDDALGYVTGNPEKMTEIISQWERISAALGPLAEDIRTAADNDLISWEGKGAEAAKQRLHDFADGLDELTNDAAGLAYLFTIARDLISAARYIVLSIITVFIEWLMWTWIPALAAAGPTFGMSTAVAASATSIRLGLAIAKVSQKLVKVARILMKLRRVLQKVHPNLMRRVQHSFERRGRHGTFDIGLFKAQANMLSNKQTYIPLALQGWNVFGTAGEATHDAATEGNATDEQDLDGLDPDK